MMHEGPESGFLLGSDPQSIPEIQIIDESSAASHEWWTTKWLHTHSVRFDNVFRAVHVHGDTGCDPVDSPAAHACRPETTRAELCHCDFSYKPYMHPPSERALGNRALRVFRGALRAYRCSISWYETAVHACAPDDVVELRECAVSECVLGISLSGSSRCVARDVHISISDTLGEIPRKTQLRPFAAILATAAAGGNACRGAAQFDQCDVFGPGAGGLFVCNGMRAAVELCRVHCGAHGISMDEEGVRGESHATVSHSQIAGSDEALRVCGAGCVMRVSACVVQGTSGAALVSGGSLSLVDTAVRGAQGESREGLVFAHNANLQLIRCEVSNAQVGVRSIGGIVSAKDTHVFCIFSQKMAQEKNFGLLTPPGGYFCQGGGLHITGGTVENCVLGVALTEGWENRDMHAGVLMSAVTVRDYLVAVQSHDPGCVFTAFDCEFVGGECESRVCEKVGEYEFAERKRAFLMENADSVVLRRCKFFQNWTAVVARDVTSVSVSGCVFRDGVSLSVSTVAGIENSQFEDVAAGVMGKLGASVILRGCEFGPVSGCAVTAEECTTAIEHCKFQHAARAVTARNRGVISLKDTTITGTHEGVFVVGEESTAVLERVVISNGEIGVQAESFLSGHPGFAVIDCQFSQFSKHAVAFLGACGKLDRCKIDRALVGVLVEFAASAWLSDCSVLGCGSGVIISQPHEALQDPCAVCGVPGQDSFQTAWSMHGGDSPGRCAHEGDRTAMWMQRVTISDCVKESVCLGSFGFLAAEEVHVGTVPAGSVGLKLHRSLNQSKFDGCTVTSGAGGGDAVVAMMHEGPESGFSLVSDPQPIPGIQVIAETSPPLTELALS